MRKYVAPAAILAACLIVVALGVRVVHVHDRYGQWRIVPTVLPLRISALDRDYKRGELEARASEPRGFEVQGTVDGYDLLVPRHLDGRTPVVIYLQDDDSRFWGYALVGGP